jgi:thiamine-monophosphate kinase
MRESDLLRHIYGQNSSLPATSASGAQVVIPPGDDMAMLHLAQRSLLIAADQVVEGKHFAPGTPPRAVGRKALLRNLSDIAAMAAVPSGCVATVVLPAHFTLEHAADLYDGLRTAADEFGCPLIGGDTSVHSRSDAPLMVSVTVVAEPGSTGRVIRRQGAQVGDLLCVTGTLGGSLNCDSGGRHLNFVPRIQMALQLVNVLQDALHAMIDISDGLGRDAAHLALAAGLDVEIQAAQLPCTAGVSWQHALSDGEDYELAFACAPDAPLDNLRSLNFEYLAPVTVVGRFTASVTAQGACRVQDPSGVWQDASRMGWEHGSTS